MNSNFIPCGSVRYACPTCWAIAFMLAFGLSTFVTAQTNDKKKAAGSYETAATKFADYKKDIVAYSKLVIEADNNETRANAVLDLCMVYFAIRTDHRYPTSETLQGYTNRINYRLNQTRKEIEKEEKRSRGSNASGEHVAPFSNVGFQPIDTQLDEITALSLFDHAILMNRLTGGPQQLVERATGHFGGIIMEANAQDLIELIEAMLHPDSWESSGGTGRIRYWSQSMVLVVRATTVVHEDLERFLNMLRRSR